MARVETDKKINPSQLSHELGVVPLRVGAGYVDADVDLATLQAKVAAHSARDGWVNPNPETRPPTPREVARTKVMQIQAGPIRDALVALLDAI